MSGSTVYAAGVFANIGGQSRNRLAVIDKTSGNAGAWNPGAGANVEALYVQDDLIYAGGWFMELGGERQDYYAQFGTVAPVITGLSPSTGLVGTEVTVNGENFGSTRENSYVSFGSEQAVDYIAWSDNQIKVKVPQGASGDVQATVTTPGGTSNTAGFNALSTWYLAEGYTGGDFDTWMLVQNPGTEDATVTLDFQLPPGSAADPYTFTLPAGTRQSVHLDELAGLSDTDVSTKVTSTHPVVAERAMYFNYQGDRAGGHDSIGY